MKKILISLLLLISLTAARAQVDTTVITPTEATTESTIGAAIPIDSMSDANIPANARAYDESYKEEDEGFSRPNRNPIYYFGSPFCEHFLEAKASVDFVGNWGAGLAYTYLPEVWGFGVDILAGSDFWISTGAAYRLSKPWNRHDWHLYGNIGFMCEDYKFFKLRPTTEIGIRMASVESLGSFSFNSWSLGIMTDYQHIYPTISVNLSLSILVSAFLLLVI